MTKKNNKYRVRRETSDKDIAEKPSRPREKLKRKVQGDATDIIYRPGKRKAKYRQNHRRNFPTEK